MLDKVLWIGQNRLKLVFVYSDQNLLFSRGLQYSIVVSKQAIKYLEHVLTSHTKAGLFIRYICSSLQLSEHFCC